MNREFFKKYFYNELGESKLTILSSPKFLAGLAIKIIASFTFASHYLTDLFVPFLKYYSFSGFQDPYSHFNSLNIPVTFPYPKAMLYVLSLPGTFFQFLFDHNIFNVSRLEIGIYRLPLLLADIIILVILSRWLKNKDDQVIWLYWFSPILFYITYLHGQLDVIPIMFSFVFLYFLFKEMWVTSYVFLAIAIATKFHIIILIPFIIVYIWQKQKNFKDIGIFFTTVIFTFLLINITSIFSTDFQKMVFENKEQIKIFGSYLKILDDVVILLVPFAYFLLFFHSLTFRSFNRDLFVMFIGFSFCILMLLIPPMPGWYYWVIPFLVYFYIKNEKFSKTSFIALNIGYFAYFIFMPKSDFLEIFQFLNYNFSHSAGIYEWLAYRGMDAQMLSNITFSFLQATLLLNVVWIYRRGVESCKEAKLHYVPYLIGLAGDSGSGKSTIAKSLQNIFKENNVAIITGDDMHKWERGDKKWEKTTHLDPKANHLHGDLKDILALQEGETIYRRRYNHDSGKFTLPQKLESKKIIVFEGLHSFFLGQMRSALDLKIFVMPEEQLRIHWKLLRDVHKRGYNKERVLEQIKKREKDSQNFIKTQEKYADITISLGTKDNLEKNPKGSVDLNIFLDIICENNINLDGFIEALLPYLQIESIMDEHSQRIRFIGKISGHNIEKVSYILVPELYDITTREPRWSDDHTGIIELFICYYIYTSLKLKKHVA